MTKKKFRIADWIDLAERWKCKKKIDDASLEACRSYLLSHLDDAKRMAKVAGDIREFLAALVKATKSQTYHWPVWEGMLKIKKGQEDRTLIVLMIDD